MKILYLFATLLLTPFYAESTPNIANADEITEEWLSNPEGPAFPYTEHVRHIKRIFNLMNVRTFMEFGVGFSTKYFLDHSERVVSVEFITNGTGPEWFIDCLHLFRNCQNWIPIAYFSGYDGDTSWARYRYKGADSVYQAAAYQPLHLLSYKAIDPSFMDDLNNFISQQTAVHNVDVAFVDSGICLRGDLVQTLFNKVPIIIAHDFGPKDLILLHDVYGYGRIVVPDTYIEIVVPFGMGTAFWIKNDRKYQKIIQDLILYSTSKPI